MYTEAGEDTDKRDSVRKFNTNNLWGESRVAETLCLPLHSMMQGAERREKQPFLIPTKRNEHPPPPASS